MQSVHITTKVASSNPAHGEVYSKQHYVIVCQWLATGRSFSPGSTVTFTNKTDRHDITDSVESDVKHHNPNPGNIVFVPFV